uniref:Uncharacterized protein n=1 Tax=Romanomermis culicivorax TaxID=13658 RepID=A0A915HKW6_ROMCU
MDKSFFEHNIPTFVHDIWQQFQDATRNIEMLIIGAVVACIVGVCCGGCCPRNKENLFHSCFNTEVRLTIALLAIISVALFVDEGREASMDQAKGMKMSETTENKGRKSGMQKPVLPRLIFEKSVGSPMPTPMGSNTLKKKGALQS